MNRLAPEGRGEHGLRLPTSRGFSTTASWAGRRSAQRRAPLELAEFTVLDQHLKTAVCSEPPRLRLDHPLFHPRLRSSVGGFRLA
jgi:hypothetical protein